MTADETDPEASATGRGAGSARAYQRRSRRENAVASGRLTRTGSPVAAAMSRLPFIATIILLLAGGIVGVLWLNTMSDATGLQATASRIRQAGIETDIQALRRDVNTLQDPARLAAEADRLGLVRAGDSALLEVGGDGRGTVIGTPTQVPGPAPESPTAAKSTPATTPATPAAGTPATTTAKSTPATSRATSAAVTTTPARSSRVTTAPVTTTPATTSRSTSTTARTGPATTTAANSSPAKSSPAKSSPAKSTPASTSAARSTPVTTPAHSVTTTTGAGR